MSDFDENPFGDPKANPFKDPSVQEAAASADTLPRLDEYNPFAEGGSKTVSTGVTSQATAATPSGSSASPPAYSASAAAPAINTDDLQKRQEELERKAAELARKEQELRGAEAANARANNWPPLPGKCIPKCFYQDINVDIPQEFQKLVRILYYVWLVYSVVLLLNIGGALGYFIVDRSNQSGQTFGLAIMYFVLFIPCSFVCWFRTVYKAFRSDSSFNFFVFFFVFFFQFVANVIMAVGIPGGGFCGVIYGLRLVGSKSAGQVVVGGIMLVLGVVFGLLAAADFVLLVKVHRIYRSTGASFQKAQQEFASGVMRSDAMQTATQQAASSAVRGAFQGNRQ